MSTPRAQGRGGVTRRVLIVGGGIVGASAAFHLARAGARVTLVDAGTPSATAASFGWINASFYLDEDHHRLRAEGLAAWHRLSSLLDLPLHWQGCLCWDAPPETLEAMHATLSGLGYPVARLTRAEIAAREPALADPPDLALHFPAEGAAASADIPARLLAAAQASGARLLRNIPVTGLLRDGETVTGVATPFGDLAADEVLIAAGTGTPALTGGAVPLKPRPAYILRTAPQPPLLAHILASPIGEVRQEPDGRLLMPTSVSHQGDSAEALTLSPVEAAGAAMMRLKALLPDLTGDWSEILKADRPVPADDKPVIGRLGPGLTVATLHSGITLGPLVGDLVARDLLEGPDNATAALLAPYRPDRFP